MGIKLVVAVTDDDWFEMLRRKPDLTEVNFWSPSPKNFRALQQGEFFLFKLHRSQKPYCRRRYLRLRQHTAMFPCLGGIWGS